MGKKSILSVTSILVKYINYKAFWLEMLVVSVLALATGPPARKTQVRLLCKQFLHGIYLTEASDGPGAAHGSPGGPPKPQLDKFHTGSAYVAIGRSFFLAGAPRGQFQPANQRAPSISSQHAL